MTNIPVRNRFGLLHEGLPGSVSSSQPHEDRSARDAPSPKFTQTALLFGDRAALAHDPSADQSSPFALAEPRRLFEKRATSNWINPMNVTSNGMSYRLTGPDHGPALVLLHGLGADHRIWDGLCLHLSPGLRVLRLDLRGHGQSLSRPQTRAMGALIGDVEQVMDELGLSDAVVLGQHLGGLIAQGLAAKRFDLVRAVILAHTAAKIGTRQMWTDRAALITETGLAPHAAAIVNGWFAKSNLDGNLRMFWQEELTAASIEGYADACLALSGSDFYTTTAALRCPALILAADQDVITPPDLVRELAELIPGARFHLLRGAGHMACMEDPRAFAAAVNTYLDEIAHLDPSP